MEGKPNVQEVPEVTRQDLRKSTRRSEDQTARAGSPAWVPPHSLLTTQRSSPQSSPQRPHHFHFSFVSPSSNISLIWSSRSLVFILVLSWDTCVDIKQIVCSPWISLSSKNQGVEGVRAPSRGCWEPGCVCILEVGDRESPDSPNTTSGSAGRVGVGWSHSCRLTTMFF